ncbi:hypothetical protein VKT23_013235 [Stygiomarasmius scandens]|uniref:Heterokaryon incompatibility domain-containing protein n=1 Tax=Marasmiellus scandens TaxID=2682957 RepID=A0ABR1J7U3_9AGAR
MLLYRLTSSVSATYGPTLCILQDSAKDKEREIAQMRTMFRNAYVTIIAASAGKVSEGFLRDVLIGTISLSPVWRQYDGSSEPVNQRAWCLEERLLSPRSLVYASHTLQYHCQTCIVNVGGAVCGPMIGQRLPNLLLLPDPDIPSSLSKSDERVLRWSWMEVLGDYTQRVVTKPGDKLVAFAAMAEQFYRVWKSEYIAGLWRSTLVRDLLWYKDYETRYLRPEKYRAPSWSWAGVDGRIVAYTMDDRLSVDDADVEACEILSCQITLATMFLPFGKVKSGILVLRSVLQKATWNPDAMMPDLYIPEEHPQTLIDDETQPSKGQTHLGYAYPDSLEDAQLDVWAIPVRWNRKLQYVAGLILTSAAEGQYRRIGHFHSPENALGGLSWMDQELHDVVIV